MSRSGYSEDCDYLDLWRRAVENSINGKRGQAFLLELIDSMEKIPSKRLIKTDLLRDGEVCALGAVGVARGIRLEGLDDEDPELIGRVFGIATCLVQEIVYENDECDGNESPEQRWTRIHSWAKENLKPENPNGNIR